VEFERPSGGDDAIAAAAKLLSEAKFPVILNGAGVVIGGAIPPRRRWPSGSMRRCAWATSTTTPSPARIRCLPGPLGYNGSKAAMELIKQADVVLCLGTRSIPSRRCPAMASTIGRRTAKIIQVDINPNRIGLTKPVTVGIVGDAKKVAEGILAKLSPKAGDQGRKERKDLISHHEVALGAGTLQSMDHEQDDPGTTWNERARKAKPDWMSPRMAWRAIQAALPRDAIISSDIGNNCAIGNAYPSFEAGPQISGPGPVRPLRLWPAVHRRCQDRLPGCASRRLLRRWRLRHCGDRTDRHRPQGMAGHHHGGLPQLSMGCGKAQLDALVRRQLRRHRA
jgi:sulfoacetaldehyde acetyltransferase